jgi:serine/threonine protein kinase
VASIIETILKLLSFIHNKAHIHGDIRPDNIFIDETASLAELKLFGIAPSSDSFARCGAAHYCPPEGYSSDQPSKRDIWATGVLAYNLLTGKRLFDEKSDEAMMKKI